MAANTAADLLVYIIIIVVVVVSFNSGSKDHKHKTGNRQEQRAKASRTLKHKTRRKHTRDKMYTEIISRWVCVSTIGSYSSTFAYTTVDRSLISTRVSAWYAEVHSHQYSLTALCSHIDSFCRLAFAKFNRATSRQWCGLRPSVLGQDRSETKKIGLCLDLARCGQMVTRKCCTLRSWSWSWSCRSGVVLWSTILSRSSSIRTQQLF